MKIKLLSSFLALCFSIATLWSQQDEKLTSRPDIERVIVSVRARAKVGDKDAFDTLKTIPKTDALDVLERYVAPIYQKHPELKEPALHMMADLQVEPIYEARLKEAADAHEIGVGFLLKRLASIKTNAAMRIVGQYLFDERSPTGLEGETWPSYSFEAAEALGTVGFDNAPAKVDPTFYTKQEVELWKTWWQSNREKFNVK